MTNRSMPIFAALIILGLGAILPSDPYFAPPVPPSSRYVVDARIDVAAGSVEGRETVTLKNAGRRPIEIVAFDWSVGAWSTLEVSVGGRRIFPPADASAGPWPKPVQMALPEPLAPGASVDLDVAFRQKPGDSRPRTGFQTSSLGPRLWWDGLEGHDAYSVKLDVPDGYAVAAGGRLDPMTGRYEAAAARNFGVYVEAGVKVLTRETDGVLIKAFCTEKGAKAAAICLETAADAVHFYKEWLGFYPFPYLNIIPGGEGRWGGYPVATGIVAVHGLETYVDGEPPTHWRHITSHEIGHEYWGEWVLEADRPAWVWIAMGIFADTEYMTVRGFDPDRAASWMGNYIDAVPMYYDTTLAAPPDREDAVKFDFNNTVVHSKGPAFAYALDAVLGRDVFLRVYKRVLKDYAGRRFGWRDLQAVAESESGASLEWFFDAWVRSNQYLCYGLEKGESRSDGHGGYATDVRVIRRGSMSMPMPVLAVFDDATTQLAVSDRTLPVTTLTFRSRAPLKDAILDPAQRLARVEAPIAAVSKAAAAELAFGWDARSAVRVYEAIKTTPIASARLWFRLGSDLYGLDRREEADACFAKVEGPGATPTLKFGALGWRGLLADLKGSRDAALAFYKAAQAIAPDTPLRFDQYKIAMDKAWIGERLKTPFVPNPADALPDHPTAERLIEYVDGLNWQKEGPAARQAFGKAQGLTIADAGFWFKLGLLLFDGESDVESLAAFVKTAELEKTGVTAFAALVWQGHMNDLLGKREAALDCYKAALKIDPGTAMTHSQWGMTIDRAWVEQRLAEPFIRK